MSSTSQHTPGPWTASTPDFESMPANRCGGCDIGIHAASGFYGVSGPGVVTLATVYDSTANARLIAAAPELLAALESAAELAEGAIKLLRQLDMESGRIAAECVLRDARAAIAKATGGEP